MTVVGIQFCLRHACQTQFLSGFCQSGSIGIIRNITRTQHVDPLLNGHLRPAVEVVGFQYEVLWIEVTHRIHIELLSLERRQLQYVAVMNTAELRLAVIHDILSLSEVEIDNVDAIYLTDILVALSAVDVFRH